jgi:hypothetical protein
VPRGDLTRAAALVAVALVLVLGVARAAEMPGGPGVLDVLQISVEQRRHLVRGDVVSYPVTEHSERELAVGLAIFVLAPLQQLGEHLAAGQLVADDASISDFGIVSDHSDSLADLRFNRAERAESESLLEASPGFRFNLSSPEIDALRALRSSTSGSGLSGVAVGAHRRLLEQRLQLYARGGLAAIAPYARSGGIVTDPAIELRLAASDLSQLDGLGPGLRDALLRFPAGQPSPLVSHFYWIKRQVQGRPQLSLLHVMAASSARLALHVERYFYVGHSYNAAQILTGAVPHEDGTVVFATSRFSTDEILGVGNRVKRSIGRTQLREEMRKRLERVRVSQIRPPSPQNP